MRAKLYGFFFFAGLTVACSPTSNQGEAAVGPNAEAPAGPDGGASDTTLDTTLDPRFFDNDVKDDEVFNHRNPDPSKIDTAVLEKIVNEAAAEQSDAVIVAWKDSIIAEKYFGHRPALTPVESITKSIVSLEIGALIDSGKIPSFDVPVSFYYPEWSTGDKAKVTILDLLAHLSGLQDEGRELFAQQDCLAYARKQPIRNVPETVFSDSNVGSMLLGGILKKAGGNDVDVLVRDRFFSPMGITKWQWSKDPAGNVMTPNGLSLMPRDLLRVGRLVRDHGLWNDQRLVSAGWMADSTDGPIHAYQCYSFHWWLLRDGCDAGIGLTGEVGPIHGPVAAGWGGNYIAVTPTTDIVAVRTKSLDPNATLEIEQKTAFPAFTHEVATLTKQ